ncbi:MAG: hypothetical protein A2632_01585 [Candidatus Pacebacteria bacterium RIFCSPHIGHO2_01_FULL_46_16]|nr:MAG: hypothetical protein A2632_01585 [Candidatus Pacebacteria bacterium RIFCSPHIGHO2_01_FULL_46_16]OGJ20167.1 MAG: hypothetical protein A3J60_04055 [Candidatus Pacebacteria bacterium RIFCSPHIGHO2_02_FULL_46_9]OGJ37737.1 MAG: hypothetical protein A3A82_00995 [Candidatus Pacebacteria bacterium RIFCSPLOWO2_01_FULL_47_12]
MSTKKTLVLLFGGISSEHDASKKSFEHVLSRLTEKKILEIFATIKIAYISREGKVLFTPYEQKHPAAWYARQPHSITIIDLLAHLTQPNIFVFSLLHGQHGEDGCMQGVAKFLGVSGSFGTVLSAAVAMSKSHCNTFVAGLGTEVHIPHSQIVSAEAAISTAIAAWRPGEKVVIKPSSLGASILTELHTIGPDNKTIAELLKKILAYDSTALLQEFIAGEEYSCGCLEEHGVVTALPLIQVITEQQFFGHSEKHTLGKNEERVIMPEQESKIHSRIRHLSERLFQEIGLQHMARFDFRVAGDKLYFLEVNPLPGMMENSLFPKMLRAAGKNIEDIVILTYWNVQQLSKKVTEFRYHID